MIKILSIVPSVKCCRCRRWRSRAGCPHTAHGSYIVIPNQSDLLIMSAGDCVSEGVDIAFCFRPTSLRTHSMSGVFMYIADTAVESYYWVAKSAPISIPSIEVYSAICHTLRVLDTIRKHGQVFDEVDQGT